ncbi:hypothetical protein QBC43DRAFT_327942 [Cladorrhinum sp. PSN259]|nr:hypothetical protein QBC43DRAFT_327942 [Cladorrhinum sp. PSN259]
MAPTRSLATALFLSLSIFSAKSRADGGRQCYLTNGKEATGYFPCDPDAENSACCNGAVGYTCLSNTLCKGPNQELVRATCTDPTWKQGGACKRYCFGGYFV